MTLERVLKRGNLMKLPSRLESKSFSFLLFNRIISMKSFFPLFNISSRPLFTIFMLIMLINMGKIMPVNSSSPQFIIPLTNSDNAAYYANVALGIPPQNFTVLIDTASGNFWVPSTFCTTSTACIGYNQYNPASSISSQTCGQQFSIHVFTNGQSSNVTGQVYRVNEFFIICLFILLFYFSYFSYLSLFHFFSIHF